MMHDKLYTYLPKDFYTALDVNGHLSPKKRSKLQDACKKSASGALHDPATSAPFGHQLEIHIGLADGAHFDPVKRCLALAIARSAGTEATAGGALIEANGRCSLFLEFRNYWLPSPS